MESSEDEVPLGANAGADELTLLDDGRAELSLSIELTLALGGAGRVEKLDGVGDDGDRLSLVLLGGLPLAPLQTPVDGHA